MLGIIPAALNSKYNFGSRGDLISNKQHDNFKLTYPFNPKTLTDKEIFQIVKQHSERLCRAFGLDRDYCFVDDQLSISPVMRDFRL
jgi:hypothetical protein